MAEFKFLLNEQETEPPFNWQDLEVELNFDQDIVQTKVATNQWRFVKDNADIINAWIEAGTTNGLGIFQGIPYRITMTEDGQTETIVNSFLDLSASPQLSCEDVTVAAKERAKVEWLNSVADGFSFEYLFENEGTITTDDFVYQPYILSSVPNYQDAALLALSIFVVLNELRSASAELVFLIEQIATGALDAEAAIVRAILYLIYLTTLIISLVKLIKELALLIIQPVKYHPGMKAKTLFEKGCEHLGLTFKSTIFAPGSSFENMVILPKKQYSPPLASDNRIFGFTSPDNTQQLGFYQGTFGDFIRDMKTLFNGKIILNDDNELLFERRDYSQAAPQFRVEDIDQPFYSFNTEEFNSNFFIEFQTDVTDKNTIQEYQGTSYQVTIRPSRTIAGQEDLIMMKGLKRVSIPFALAKTKTDLTVPEEMLLGFLDDASQLLNTITKNANKILNVVNSVVKVLQKAIKILKALGINVELNIPSIKPFQPVDFGEVVENRKGMLLIETDIINVPKIYILKKDHPASPRLHKVHELNGTILSARNIWNSYYSIDSFVPSDDLPNGNQYIKKSIDNHPFCLHHFLMFRNNNTLVDIENREGRADSIRWKPIQGVANLDYRISHLYTNNFIQYTNEPSGL